MHRKDMVITYADYANDEKAPVTIGTTSTAAVEIVTEGFAVVRFVADAVCNIFVGPSGMGAATSSHYRVPANSPVYIGFDKGRDMSHYRVIADAAAGTLSLGIVA